MSVEVKIPKKLIEVALPLDIINSASVREKSIRHGHPSTMHLWWARRPLAAARAVIFSQLVNDPGYERHLGRGVNKENARAERERLFGIIERLVKWENTNDETVLREARAEIQKSWRETCALNKSHPRANELFDPDKLPEFHDPFAGGGAIPLEALRLGFRANASDLNPVAVLVNKAMIEYPQLFALKKPVFRQGDVHSISSSSSVHNIAEDVRCYGHLMRDKAIDRLRKLYPNVRVKKEWSRGRPDLTGLANKELTPIAWLWARTVKCPSPACGIMMPLLSTLYLSSKEGKETYLIPKIDGSKISFDVSLEKPKGLNAEGGYKKGVSGIFECCKCGAVTTRDYVAAEGVAKRIGTIPTAVVCESPSGRIYLPAEDIDITRTNEIDFSYLNLEFAPNPRDTWCRNFGLMTPKDVFTSRQLILLNTLSDITSELIEKICTDAVKAGLRNDQLGLENGGSGAKAYGELIGIYLAFASNKIANLGSSLTSWMNDRGAFRETFARQAIPMVWDFAEANPFSDSAGNILTAIDKISKTIEKLPEGGGAKVFQADASVQLISKDKIISTDPPYYDNISYADLSDFFYVWLKHTLGSSFPSLFKEQQTPKKNELVAMAYRHNSKREAENFFMSGMTRAIQQLHDLSHPGFPISIYYAFKQSETREDGTSSTGWETFLEAVLKSGLEITGTWPMRTEGSGRIVAKGTNALASSIVLVCRKRDPSAPSISRREFLRELNSTLPEALSEMTRGGGISSPVAPVDLSQAIIGPGMEVFSKYSAILEADGSPMTVKTAMQLINRFLAEDDFDPDTQFCLHWFEEYGWKPGKSGVADVLARAKGTSIEGLCHAGIAESVSGFVRLLSPKELASDWSPTQDDRLSVWEILHQMIRVLGIGGESDAGKILTRLHESSERIRTLAYRNYTLCERKGWTQDASQYDQIVRAWDNIEVAAQSIGYSGEQISLFGDDTQEKPIVNLKNRKQTRKKKNDT